MFWGGGLVGVPHLPPVPRSYRALRDVLWTAYDEDMTGRPSATWTILVPTLGERRPLFERLMGVLLPQLDAHAGRVRVMAHYNNGQPTLPEIRQRMVQAVDADYVSCVDDDDLVPDYFVDEMLTAIDQGPDYVGFQVQCYSDGRPTAISYHSLAYQGWYERDGRYFRDISHLNPIRRDLALRATFTRAKAGMPEDRAWVEQLRRSRLLQKEVVIDRIMYHYLYSTSRSAGIGSRWRAPKLIRPGDQPAEILHPFFSYCPGSVDA